MSLGAAVSIRVSSLLHIDKINLTFTLVTLSHTTAFWTWDDWELQLDWLALRGVNLPLAWVAAQKILVEVLQEIGLTESNIGSFLSGPVF